MYVAEVKSSYVWFQNPEKRLRCKSCTNQWFCNTHTGFLPTLSDNNTHTLSLFLLHTIEHTHTHTHIWPVIKFQKYVVARCASGVDKWGSVCVRESESVCVRERERGWPRCLYKDRSGKSWAQQTLTGKQRIEPHQYVKIQFNPFVHSLLFGH